MHPAARILSRPLRFAVARPLPSSPSVPLARRFASSCCNTSSPAKPASSPAQARTKFTMAGSDNQSVSQYLEQSHERLFEYNRQWAADKAAKDPEYFVRLNAGQAPEYLWIGCSDSRIPVEQLLGLEPGEAFVHRNIANLVVNTDLSVMSVINYAVRHLGVKHIIVCGHYGCGGVKAAMTPKDLGLLNPWLRNIRDVYRLHEAELDAIADQDARYNRLVELSVVEQCRNVIKTAAIQQSFKKNQYPIVHGWVFDFKDGLVKDLKVDFKAMLEGIQKIYNLSDE
ncbi:Putative Carbonic anhydrase [[Torrubiella] hemipterigena]|uniref:Carbonic anhydrase n=1 Tax=[Torrubiella] hemipterigena TaxID=1531966 RepID=A0A0A1SPX6_9HYPO|nr:Putative Carbonic anhydrase [[Torrubiella] hemipterigena]